MSESFLFHRGFETKVFSNKNDKTIFMLREYLIRTAANLWLHQDIIQQYLEVDSQEKKVKGLKDFFLYLSNGHIHLNTYIQDGVFFCGLTFVDELGAPIDIESIETPTKQKILEIIGYDDFSLQDAKIVGFSTESMSLAIIKLLHQFQKKYV